MRKVKNNLKNVFNKKKLFVKLISFKKRKYNEQKYNSKHTGYYYYNNTYVIFLC